VPWDLGLAVLPSVASRQVVDILEWRADQLIARRAGQRLHPPVDVRDDAGRVRGHSWVNVRFDQGPDIDLLIPEVLSRRPASPLVRPLGSWSVARRRRIEGEQQ
jgi:hypothetical protein